MSTKYNAFYVARGREKGSEETYYEVGFEERSMFRDFVMRVIDNIDAALDHKLCERTHIWNNFFNWSEKPVVRRETHLRITKEQAKIIEGPDAAWLYEDEEDEDGKASDTTGK